MTLYETLSNLFANLAPRKVIKHVDSMLRYAGMRMSAKVWIGSTLLVAELWAMVTILSLWILFEVTDVSLLLGAGLSIALLSIALFYYTLYLKVEDRRKRVEKVLPDALQMIAANLRAGVTPLVALRMAARPEFGPLESEINLATTKALGTESFTEALSEITTRIRSEMLDRTLSLFTTSLRSGGNLASLLENTATEILEAQELRKELIAETNMYVVFIMFTMLVGMPLLFSISMEFVGMVEKLRMEGTGGTYTAELGLAVSPPVPASFIEVIAIFSLVATSVVTSMLIGVIHDGKEWNGLKYAPLFITASILMFFLFKTYVLKAIVGI